ncbi:MFS transporter [Prauserella cavernicola]|uniref:MFS transporter n=1 Tax=Prauserella cavernicola TaxID=2800127 RepID=A0A934QSU2_9PSEU|nr:MFS transporter [Prauserella cavernicola]MBK1785598.1 MFS transporter [Prauserella cavernicola]
MRFVDLRPLRSSPDFRRLWTGTTTSTVGGQIALVAVLAQVWDLTGSSVAVGAIGLTNAVPMILFGLLGGVLADSVDRRKLVLGTTLAQFATAAMLAAQALVGLGSLAVVLTLVAVQGTCMGLGAPARRTFVARLLPEHQVSAGVALNHLSFQAAMLAGPAIAGVVIAGWGVGACYVVDALAFTVACYGVFRLPAMRPSGEPTRPGPRAIWEGWRFIGRRPVLRGAFLSDVLATVLAMPIALFPAINAERFGGDPETLGLFLSAIAVGGIAAGLASGTITGAQRPGLVMLVSAGVWGAALVGFGLADSLWLTLCCLAVAGAADTFSVVSRGSLVQLATPDSHRGRVTSVEYVVGAAGPDVGNFRAGLVAGATSPVFAAVAGGALCVAGVAVLGLTSTPLRRFRIGRPTESPA